MFIKIYNIYSNKTSLLIIILYSMCFLLTSSILKINEGNLMTNINSLYSKSNNILFKVMMVKLY